MSKTALSPDEAAAHMYPSDLKKFEFGEHVADAFSIAVGCPDEVSVPLFTTTQAEAYADARALEAQQWQPIETAPKDGTNIILTDGKRVTVGNWHREKPYIHEYRDVAGNYAGQDESDGFDGWVDWSGGITPAHWMPLPAPPSTPA